MKHCWHRLPTYFQCCFCGVIVPIRHLDSVDGHGKFHPEAGEPDVQATVIRDCYRDV